MFKLIARTAIAFVTATVVAQATPSIQTGHVTFVDEVSGQILVDNQLVAMTGELSNAGLRLGDEVALAMTDDLATSAIAKSETLPVDSSTQAAMGIVTYADAETGIVVLDNSIVLTVDGSSLAALRLGQMAETRYSDIAGMKLAGAITVIE